ncbi:MAG: PhoH family protein [Gammaproteobacteria bacterium]|jgi:phosphate starvation-inducible PhoH-like protein|nr:PhoH family protein [Gammaproteobacteria bacterium]
MAKQSRNKGKTVHHPMKHRVLSRHTSDKDVVVDINDFTCHHERSRSGSCKHPLIQARNQAQGQYLAAIRSNQLVFGLGPAGTGKTFCATAMAVEAFERRETRRIIFTRPAIESGESLGFLPGKLMDKLEPYFSTFRNYLTDMLGRGVVECALKNGHIQFEPLAFMRGKTFDDAFVILDEAQNCTRLQLKMFLTRIGENSRVIINGDTQQTDIGCGSGLRDTANRLHDLDSVYIHEFTCSDIVRSELVRTIMARYETG